MATALVLLIGLLLPLPVRAGTLVVNTTADDGGGSAPNCTAGTGTCTLRGALAAATTGDTITFATTGTILLNSTLAINRSLTIQGPGAASLTVNGQGRTGVFTVGPGLTVTLAGFTIQRGYAKTGAGVQSSGTLTVNDMIFNGNEASVDGFGGGAIRDDGGALTVTNTIFSGNYSGRANGGAISGGGMLSVTNSTFVDNYANGGGDGGAISGSGTLTVTNSSFKHNVATRGGAIYFSGVVAVTVANSTFTGNGADNGGALYSNSSNGTRTVTNSTFDRNQAVFGVGGAIRIDGGQLTVTSSTFSRNFASGPDALFIGGALFNGNSTVQFRSNIIVGGAPASNCSGKAAIAGAPLINSEGDNLSDDTKCFPASATLNDRIISPTTPLLGALGDYGGPTQTMPNLAGSPAIDGVTHNACPPPLTDQRGVVRPQGAACDIGAYEGFVTLTPTATATATRTATPYSRPNVGVQVTPGPGADQLQATLIAREAGCVPNNQLQALRFTRLTNTTIDVPGVGTISTAANTSIPLPGLPPTVTLTVHRVVGGQAATAELVVTDGCGTWPTLVGGGPSAFAPLPPSSAAATITPSTISGSTGAAVNMPSSTATPSPPASPSAIASPPIICAPRPAVRVTTASDGAGRLAVTVSTDADTPVTLQALRFGMATNAQVTAGSQSGSGSFTVALPPGTRRTTFSVMRLVAGQASTVPLVVVDSCGDWPTVVGGGPTAF